ncbi:MAG: phosphoglycerate mutase [Dehalococcoidia bacterium SM23_28_2]|nr:MAG: phosphoglycerate mutase [Dehalococcoidia bacterium SM23_28_2]
MDFELIREIAIPAETKIVLLVMDGLGGLPDPQTGRTEMETARIPNLDRLAQEGICGMVYHVGVGITPGSGPGHLALFSYDPLRYRIGRGALEAVGIDFDLGPRDVAARGNFCTVDDGGLVVDRRAGRIDTDTCARLCAELRTIDLPGAELFVEPVREHRFLLALRGDGLSDALSETDPQQVGVPPLGVAARAPAAKATAALVSAFVAAARERLRGHHPANMVLLRGFARWPDLPSFPEVYGLRAAAIAYYPMYRGLAKLVGMTALPAGPSLSDSLAALREHWEQFDFFFVHYKATDSAGEDGDFQRKVAKVEEVDAIIPELLSLKPDVLMVTGDHSTPSAYRAHSWHPVPFVLRSRWCQADMAGAFNERDCQKGSLGLFAATEIMPLAMAHADRFTKYGA